MGSSTSTPAGLSLRLRGMWGRGRESLARRPGGALWVLSPSFPLLVPRSPCGQQGEVSPWESGRRAPRVWDPHLADPALPSTGGAAPPPPLQEGGLRGRRVLPVDGHGRAAHGPRVRLRLHLQILLPRPGEARREVGSVWRGQTRVFEFAPGAGQGGVSRRRPGACGLRGQGQQEAPDLPAGGRGAPARPEDPHPPSSLGPPWAQASAPSAPRPGEPGTGLGDRTGALSPNAHRPWKSVHGRFFRRS